MAPERQILERAERSLNLSLNQIRHEQKQIDELSKVKAEFLLLDRVYELATELRLLMNDGQNTGYHLIEALNPNNGAKRETILQAIDAHNDYRQKIKSIAERLGQCGVELEELQKDVTR